jgi:hypothetical protein
VIGVRRRSAWRSAGGRPAALKPNPTRVTARAIRQFTRTSAISALIRAWQLRARVRLQGARLKPFTFAHCLASDRHRVSGTGSPRCDDVSKPQKPASHVGCSHTLYRRILLDPFALTRSQESYLRGAIGAFASGAFSLFASYEFKRCRRRMRGMYELARVDPVRHCTNSRC